MKDKLLKYDELYQMHFRDKEERRESEGQAAGCCKRCCKGGFG